jgi:hypothetical protein
MFIICTKIYTLKSDLIKNASGGKKADRTVQYLVNGARMNNVFIYSLNLTRAQQPNNNFKLSRNMPEEKTPPIDIPAGDSRLNVLYRWIRKLPVGSKARYRLKKTLSVFMKWYNTRYHNLPSAFPSDFAFERIGEHRYRAKQRRLTISLKDSLVKRKEEAFERESIGDKDEYVLKKSDSNDFAISVADGMKLYLLIRNMGFIHFDHEDIHVSFEAETSTRYRLTAHGKTYFFSEATESPLHPRWQKNCEQIDLLLNELAGIENIVELDFSIVKKV